MTLGANWGAGDMKMMVTNDLILSVLFLSFGYKFYSFGFVAVLFY